MASSQDFVEFVCEQINFAGDISYKKMFGEYMVYVNLKPIILICDNTAYVKMRDEIADIMQDCQTGVPYKGSKEHYIIDVEDTMHSADVIRILEAITPIPKPRKKKKTN